MWVETLAKIQETDKELSGNRETGELLCNRVNAMGESRHRRTRIKNDQILDNDP